MRTLLLVLAVSLSGCLSSSEPERRGCCSHHGGVCGCGGTKALCCDGTLSKTCGCD